jgi:ubiquinol-cytochrome c reductase cytochrome b subunit
MVSALPPEQALPDSQPAYVASWIYVFGVATLAALIMIIVSGIVIAVGGINWWHTTAVGHFFNSLHLWSVELFFFFMVIHLWGKFFMAAWRGRRALTWITGVVAFLISIATAFTGYLVQTNFDSQWIATQAKDGINATGAGAFWNVLNLGQMLLWHIMLLPLGVGIIVVLHVILVRLRGVVPPIGIGSDGEPTSDPKARR